MCGAVGRTRPWASDAQVQDDIHGTVIDPRLPWLERIRSECAEREIIEAEGDLILQMADPIVVEAGRNIGQVGDDLVLLSAVITRNRPVQRRLDGGVGARQFGNIDLARLWPANRVGVGAHHPEGGP